MVELSLYKRRLGAVKGLLIDLDGVLYIGDSAIEGAAEALGALRRAGVPMRFVTNTTTRSRKMIYERTVKIGLSISVDEIVNAPRAAAAYIRSIGNPRCRFVVADAVEEEFGGIVRDNENPELIVIGDIGQRWDYGLMSSLFEDLIAGAKLIALHKGRYFQGPEGLILDIGAFVSGLEYASGVSATVIGKPSEAFFHSAALDMSVSPDHCAMIGDDIESDVGGAQAAGLAGILVKTGKYRAHLAAASSVRPDAVVRSIADVPNLLGV